MEKKPTKIYIKETFLRDRITHSKNVPSLESNPRIFLESTQYAEWLVGVVQPSGEWGVKIWGSEITDSGETVTAKNRLIHARFWCDCLKKAGHWEHTLLLSPQHNPTFALEATRLHEAGVLGDLVNVRGDGNCMYYCMLHYLSERNMTDVKYDYPVFG